MNRLLLVMVAAMLCLAAGPEDVWRRAQQQEFDRPLREQAWQRREQERQELLNAIRGIQGTARDLELLKQVQIIAELGTRDAQQIAYLNEIVTEQGRALEKLSNDIIRLHNRVLALEEN